METKFATKPFYWVWVYQDHRIEIVLTQPVADTWRLSIRVRRWDSRGDGLTISELEHGRFSTAHDALCSAEQCAIQYVDAIESE